MADRGVQGLLWARFTDGRGKWKKCARKKSAKLVRLVGSLVVADIEDTGPFAAYEEESCTLLIAMAAQIVVESSWRVFDETGLAAGTGRDQEGRFVPKGPGGKCELAACVHRHI